MPKEVRSGGPLLCRTDKLQSAAVVRPGLHGGRSRCDARGVPVGVLEGWNSRLHPPVQEPDAPVMCWVYAGPDSSLSSLAAARALYGVLQTTGLVVEPAAALAFNPAPEVAFELVSPLHPFPLTNAVDVCRRNVGSESD